MATLSLQGIGKTYGTSQSRTRVLDDISLEVAEGEFLVLVGPSGCGKSTLLRIVAGLVDASEGDVVLDGERVNHRSPRQRDVAMVFQNYALYPHMTVRANLAFPLRTVPRGETRLDRAQIAERVGQAADILGLGPLLDRKPSELSGGQMQRVAVGRAIVRQPRLFLFDEPLSNLDAKLRAEMRQEFAALHRRLGITTLYVTHDQAEAMTLGSRIAVLDRGRLSQVGPPLEVFERPATRFVAGFIGSPPMNLLEGHRESGCFKLGHLNVPCPVGGEGPLVLGVRPEDVREDPQGTLELPVAAVAALGNSTHIACSLGQSELHFTRPGGTHTVVGASVRLSLPAGRLHWFEADAVGARLDPDPGE